MAVSWRKAYLRQSYSDSQLFLFLQHIKRYDVAPCHTYHFLQMATEKMARGFFMKPETSALPVRTHRGFVTFVRQAGSGGKHFNHLYLQLKLKPNKVSGFFKKLEPIADTIEKLAPALCKDGINPEYPWEDNAGIQVPSLYTNWSSSLSPVQIIKLSALLNAIYKVEGLT